jgi:glyoxylase-like metal-dependent hydrolase (beta-lactamase superfamily II)
VTGARLLAAALLVLGVAPAARPAAADPAAATRAAGAPPAGVTIEKLADGVYAAIRREPAGFIFQSNSVFVIGPDDVIVVDTQFTLEATREVLAALRAVTSKPVRFVVNTHWHDDHVTGNQVYRDAFPGVAFVACTAMGQDMATEGAKNRAAYAKSARGTVGYLADLLARDRDLGGRPMDAEEHRSYASDTTLVGRYAAEAAEVEPVLPTITFDDSLTLHQGARDIQLLRLGRAHTRGDIVVRLPQEDIVVAGDLVVWPVPTVGTTSYPLDFPRTLDRLLALGATTIVPGHGPVMRNDAYVRQVKALLESLDRQVLAAVARGDTLEQVRAAVRLDAFRDALAAGHPLREDVFDYYVAQPAVARAYAQATAAAPDPGRP